jgi:hypothetical protein
MKWKFFSVLTVLILALAGCAMDGDNQDGTMGDNRDNNNVEQTRFNDTNRGMNDNRDYGMRRTSEREQERDDNTAGNNNDRYEVADEAADRITEQVDEIDRAYVLTTENNAYVAAGLDIDRSDRNDRDGQGTANNPNRNATNGDRNVQDNTNNLTRNTTDGIDNDHFDDQLSDDVKEEIADIVKSVNNDIDNVYVSTNPDFFDLTNNYADDMNNEEPVEGFFDQIGNAIERLFPQNR